MRCISNWRFTVASLIGNLLASAAFAQLVEVPSLPDFGDSNNLAPFSSSEPMRYQQIYSASAFPHGGIIDKINFRHNEGSANVHGPIDFDLQVAISYAATTVATVSPVFAENIGDNFTIVFDGILTESHSAPGSPVFGFVLDVSDTFVYNPAHGDLLVQILRRHELQRAPTFDASFQAQQQVTTRVYAASLDAETGEVGLGFGDNQLYGLVTQFEFLPVPEPASLALAAVAATFLPRRRRT